ncbi:MAG: ExeM/NucH family extracellular endonuclease [Anaerolineae bacterium]|jgi:predicted extracellular nuclease|nr:ExeM/NucH family extracellular endonuclease [Anaerolineae bacterium]
MAASVVLTAADEDSQVNGAVLTSTPVSGISLGPVSPAAGEGGSATVSLQVSDAVAAGSYPVVVQFNNDEAQSASCTVNVTVPAAPTLTPIPAIQGTGETSPLLGQTLTTSGVVTAVFPGLRGFYLQDPLGDGDSASADGIFVYVNSATMPAGIAVGNQVRLTGKVAEFSGQTELTNPASMVVLASGLSVAPTEVVLPEAFNGELERYEGMLVQLATPMTVAQNYFLGRYGQLTLAADGPLEKATDRHPARSPEAIALAEENQRRLLVLDDGTTQQNPSPTPYLGADNTLRAGDRVAEALLGVLDQGPIDAGSPATLDYRLHPIQTPSFLRDNPRMAAPGPVGGNVKVASFNVLNYFNGDGAGGGFPTSRGASNPAEFERQRAKIIGALAVINADVVGLMEIENDGDGALSAIQNLVNGLNAVLGAGTYAVVADPATGTGSDAIKVALIYKPGRLALAGSALSDPHPIHNRPPLAQTFAAPNGERFSVVVNHFKSKSCADALGEDLDQGDGQGCYNARRLAQATALLAFLEQLKAAAGDQDLLVIGDLNAYGKEDPVLALAAGGLANQLAERGTLPYSYVFDGERGTLDHALASPSLAGQVAGAGHWHINADEPSFLDYNLEFKQPACLACEPDLYRPTAYRSSDHDPVIVGLQLLHGVAGTPGRDLLSGTPGDDVLEGGAGPDVLTGGGGADLFVYRDLAEALDTITDFTPGLDRLDLRGLFASLGLAAGDPVAGGYLRIQPLGLGCSVMIDPDGTVGPQKFRPLVKLQGVPADHLVVARDILR